MPTRQQLTKSGSGGWPTFTPPQNAAHAALCGLVLHRPSYPLRERLKKCGIDLIVPYRNNSKHRRYEDGRKLRRYKRRWIIERTNAWLGQFRRLLVRHEHLLETYRAFFYLACLWITLRRCL